MPVPDAWRDQPEMDFGSQEFLDGFYSLTNSRMLFPGGLVNPGSVGFIPLAEIETYCRLAGVEDRETFMRVVRHLDRIYVAYQNDKLTASVKKT